MLATIFGRPALGSAAAMGILLSTAVTPAAAAMTEVFYQRVFDLTCAGNLCEMQVPVVAKTKVNIRWVSCYFASQDSATARGSLGFQYVGSDPDRQVLPPITVDATTSLFVQEMDILLLPQKYNELRLTSDGGATAASCTLTGRLQKFS